MGLLASIYRWRPDKKYKFSKYNRLFNSNSFVMKLLKCNRTDIIALINQFNNECEDLRKQIPMNIFLKLYILILKGN